MINGKNRYRRVIDLALSLPEYQPPTIEPVTQQQSRIEKLKDKLMRPRRIKDDVQRAYSIFVSAARGHITLEDRVPASELHRHMALHINRLTAEAMLRGGLPMSIHVFDRFLSFIDFGKGRVLRLHVQLHSRPKSQSAASFIVEEAPDADLSIFDQVPHIPFHINEPDKQGAEPTILSAQVWSADIEPENNKRKN